MLACQLVDHLINGAQSLFGFKTQLKFGATTIDAVISEQRSQSSTIMQIQWSI